MTLRRAHLDFEWHIWENQARHSRNGNMQMRKGTGTRSVGSHIRKESQEDHQEEVYPYQTEPLSTHAIVLNRRQAEGAKWAEWERILQCAPFKKKHFPDPNSFTDVIQAVDILGILEGNVPLKDPLLFHVQTPGRKA